MEWKEQAAEIRRLLKLARPPLAVNYAVKLPSAQEPQKHLVCEALLLASEGAILDLSVETLDCPTAVRALGLGDPLRERYPQSEASAPHQDSQVYCEAATRLRDQPAKAPSPIRLADHILLAPADRAEICPDLILFICNAEQACRLVALDSCQTGAAPRLEISGSTCHQIITYPYVTGELNLSLLDFINRKALGYRPEDLLVSVPWAHFEGIIASLDISPAGRREK